MSLSLTNVSRVDMAIEPYLAQVGDVFRAFRDQDSGCVSYGVLAGGQRWFVKHSRDPRGLASLGRAQVLHSRIRHQALPRLHNTFETPGGLALVYDWVPGELLYYPSRFLSVQRRDPALPPVRFRALPLAQILASLDTIYSVHLVLAENGYIAVDFYDGCIIYDFEQSQTHLCDLDEYREGPFTNETNRLPGSRRFMAPEEFQRGARIDQATNVFTLGRTALLLLGDGSATMESFKGTDAMKAVVTRATSSERAGRHQAVREFVDDWRAAQRACSPS